MNDGPLSTIDAAGRVGRHFSHAKVIRLARAAAQRAAPVLLATVAALAVATPALGASGPADAATARVARSVEATTGLRATVEAPVLAVAEQDQRDAFEGGLTPQARRIVVPSIELGLTQQRPIPVGVTCSCTIDRTGLISQFDITVIEVVQDATAMVQQLNRFNRPPRPGARYLAAYVGQQYVAGPENQAYTTTESDWKAAGNDQRLSDAAQLLHTEVEYRPRADVYPSNYVNGWLIFELPLNRPAYLVWNYNFVGERGIWFALQ